MRSCSSFNVFAQQKNKQFASRDALFLRNEEEKTSGLLSHCVFFRKSKRQNAAHGKCFLNKPFFVLLARWKKLLAFLWSVARQRKVKLWLWKWNEPSFCGRVSFKKLLLCFVRVQKEDTFNINYPLSTIPKLLRSNINYCKVFQKNKDQLLTILPRSRSNILYCFSEVDCRDELSSGNKLLTIQYQLARPFSRDTITDH